MAKKKFDPKAKAKRQKVIAAVGGMLLVGILAIQVPRTMKMMSSQSASSSSSSSASASSSTTPATTQPLAPPSLDGSSVASSGPAPSPASTTAEGVSDPTSPLPPSAGQLISFSRFKSKDPFKQQIATACGTDSTSANGSACATTSNAGPKAKTTAPAGAAGVAPSGGQAKPAQFVSAKPTKAIISVNGVAGVVSVAASFPAAAPVFTLVSLTRTAAKIGIAGGSYENGAATVTLPKGQALTLLNTADGTRYVLRLVSTG
jgi:hypothetical protein